MDKGRRINVSDDVPLISPIERQMLCEAEGGSSAMLAFTLGVLRHKRLDGGRVNLVNSIEKKGKLRLIQGRKSRRELDYEVRLRRAPVARIFKEV